MRGTGSDDMNRISKNVLMLSMFAVDDAKEKRILKKYYEQIHLGRGIPDDDDVGFLKFLADEGIISRGYKDSDEPAVPPPDAQKIDGIIREYYRYKEEEFLKN